jgi:hypothetical protein
MFSVTAALTSQCDAHGFVYYPSLLWLFYVPVIAVKLRWQFVCLKYTTIPYVQAVGSFKVLRCIDAGFLAWYIMTTLMSICQSLDYGTDGFFIAVVLRAGQCSGGRMEAIWHEVMSQSVFHGHFSVSFTTTAIISFILMFLQPLFAFLHTTPKWSETPKYAVGESEPYQNLLGSSKNMGDALFDLADCSEMCSIQVQSPQFPHAKALKAWEECEPHDKISRVLSFTHNALNRSLSRIGLVTLMENAYQINLQVSILGLFLFILDNEEEFGANAAALHRMQWQTKASIALSVFQACIRLGEVKQILSFGFWTIAKVHSARDDITYHQLGNGDGTIVTPRTSSDISWVKAKVVLIIVFTLAFISITGYAVCKVYFVLWVCEDRLWNLTGCVELTHLKKEFSH